MAITALLQDSSSGNIVVIVSAMTSFVTLVGVIVSGFVQWSGQRDARDAARDARDAATEAKTTTDKIETLVNNRSDVQAQLIKEAKEEIAALNAALLAKAEASPAIGKVGADPEPTEVVVVEALNPLDVNVLKPPKAP